MLSNNRDYISNIADELKINILSRLNTLDAIKLCNAINAFKHLLCERNVMNKVKCFNEYRLDVRTFRSFIGNSIRPELVTLLNINCIYWIPAVGIRKCFAKLSNLKHLYVVDTKVSLSAIDMVSYSALEKLSTLAVSASDNVIDCTRRHAFFSNLRRFYVQLDVCMHNSIDDLRVLILFMKNLQELWIIDAPKHHYSLGFVRCIPRTQLPLKKLTLMFGAPLDFAMARNIRGEKLFQTTRQSGQICYDMTNTQAINKIYDEWKFVGPSWDVLINKLKCDLPFGVEETKKLISGCKFEDMRFRELNFYHAPSLCCKLLRDTVQDILSSENINLLKKLSINFCISAKSSNKLMKTECNMSVSSLAISPVNKATLEQITENSPLIEELEFWGCTLNGIDDTQFYSITKLQKLKKLTLHSVPIYLNCTFLIDVCKNCPELESLRIHSEKQHSALNVNFCLALPYSTALKDLRYENTYIPLDRLFQVLSTANLKLQRLYIKCDRTEEIRTTPVERFLNANPGLKFLCVVLTKIPKNTVRTFQQVVNRFKKEAQQVFVVTQDENTFKGRLPVPFIHKFEMLRCDTRVSTLDILNGFVEY